MSDRSSQSSGEWVILNEDDDELDLDSNEHSLNLELRYDAICQAVSESIRSSSSSEELEWQYEQEEDYISSHRPPFIQEVLPRDFDDIDDCQSEDSNVEDEVVNKCVSTSDIEEENNINVTSISKIHSYKHNRNDRLNFILNFTLALVVASTVGLGIGHFLGWSHKCFKGASIVSKAADNIVESPHTVIIEHKNGIGEHSENDGNSPLLTENMSNSVICTDFNSGDSSVPHSICGASVNSNIAIDSELAETSIYMTSDVLEFKAEEGHLENNFSNPYILSIAPESHTSTKTDWNEFSSLEAVARKIYGMKKVSSNNADIDPLIEEEVNNIELELLPRNIIEEKVPDVDDIANDPEIPFLTSETDSFTFKNTLNKNDFEILNEFFNEEKVFNRGNTLTNQLRKDLNEVVQSLAAISLARLSDINEKYSSSIEESGAVIKLFSDFQTLINSRITDIENNLEHKDVSKFNLKHLQKMVYTLVDSVDYLMKVSFKTLSKDGRKINVHKFSNNISKVIFYFNKKWDKRKRVWSESVEKGKDKKFRDGYFKKGKENKHWKNKAQFDKHSKSSFKYKNSMKL